MLGKAILIFVLLGTVCSEPIRRSIMPTDLIKPIIKGYVEQFGLAVLGNEVIQSIDRFINGAVGFQQSALESGVQVIQWVVTNLVSVTIGAAMALGVCQFTGKCNLSYELSIARLFFSVPMEKLERAQCILVSALKHFAEEDEPENKENDERGEKEISAKDVVENEEDLTEDKAEEEDEQTK